MNCKIFISIVLLVLYNTAKVKTLLVEVYYESLCPDSREFITTQLYPTYAKSFNKNLDLLNIQFIPFGFANATLGDDGKWTFFCQHGDNECYGNKVQSCALYFNTQAQGIDFVNCAMSSEDNAIIEANLKICSVEAGIEWDFVKLCVENAGDDLLARNQVRTHDLNPPLASVPTVIFDGVFDSTLQNQAVVDFFDTVCMLIPDKPKECLMTYKH